jgi:hypothetical protein
VTATAPGYTGDTLQVTLTVGGGGSGHAIVWSAQANRTAPTVLEGASVAGTIYAFLSPEVGVTRVRFYLDGVLRQTENAAPFDFAGTAPNGTAQGFNTTQISDGPHDITAVVDLASGGTTTLTSEFTVANNSPALLFNPESVTLNVAQGGSTTAQVTLADNNAAGAATYTVSATASWLTVSPPGSGTTPATLTLTADASGLEAGTHTATVTATAPGYTGDTLPVTLSVSGGGGSYALVWSTQANRASPTALAGAQVSGNIYAFVTPGTGVKRVRFYLDDPNMTGPPRQVENTEPHDFAGGKVETANPFSTDSVSNGSHTITAAVERSTGGTDVVHATFTVANP